MGRAVTLISALVVVAACSPGGDDTSTPASASARSGDEATVAGPGVVIDSVAVIGDSITFGSEEEVVGVLEQRELDVVVDAVSGRRMTVEVGSIDSGLDAIERVEPSDPDLWVVALGSNDVANLDPDEAGAAIDELLDAIPHDAPLVWVDVYLARFPVDSAEFNRVLRDHLADRGRAEVVDWASIAPADGILSDGVHPSAAGRLRFAAAIAEGVDRWRD